MIRCIVGFLCLGVPLHGQGWTQWGGDAQHSGFVPRAGQSPSSLLGQIVYDPVVQFAKLDVATDEDPEGFILTHYPAPLLDGDDVFMVFKSGTWISCLSEARPCGSDTWDQLTWGVKRFRWEEGSLVEKWTFASDWKPEPDRGGLGGRVGFGGWEPVFHPALHRDFVYVPGSAGTVYKLNREDGSVAAHIDPFNEAGLNVYVAGPLSVDSAGSIYYNAIQLDAGEPWTSNVPGSWLVKIAEDDSIYFASIESVTPGAPWAWDLCKTTFRAGTDARPWPPAPEAVPQSAECGSQRPGINIAPAVAPDGTIYTVTRAHFNSRYSYIVAINPDLTPKWIASLRDRLNDGCGVLAACREGTTQGVEPNTNDLPAGQVSDLSSSSPVVAPDGSILYGL